MLAFTGHVRPVCPCYGNCCVRQLNGILLLRNGDMFIPGGHVLFVHLVPERILSQGLFTNT